MQFLHFFLKLSGDNQRAGTCIPFEYLFPGNFEIKIPEIGAYLPGKDLDSRAFTNTISTQYPRYFSFNRYGKTIQGKPVPAITMRGVLSSSGRLTISIASKGHFLMQISATDTEPLLISGLYHLHR